MTTDSVKKADPTQAMLDSLGGTKGMIYTAIPVLVFVIANAVAPLPITIAVAMTVAAAVTGFRLMRGERLMPALGGLIGVSTASGVALWTGSAGGFFLLGIWASLAGAVLTLATVLARRPLTGLLWNAVHGNKHPWRKNSSTLAAHDIATLTLTALFGARYFVQNWLYESDATGWLAVAKIGMGTPLLALALLVAVWAFRRSTKQFTGK